MALNVDSAEHEELLTACDISQSKLDNSLAQARELMENLQAPSRAVSPSPEEEKLMEEVDEAMDTDDATETAEDE